MVAKIDFIIDVKDRTKEAPRKMPSLKNMVAIHTAIKEYAECEGISFEDVVGIIHDSTFQNRRAEMRRQADQLDQL